MGLFCPPNAFADAATNNASPDHVVCDPAANTVLSSTATSYATAWTPTSVSSSFLSGPGTISRTLSSTSTVGVTLSASFTVEESLLFASAKETYGVSLAASLAHTATWTYALNVPSGRTAKVQQLHQRPN